MLRSCYGNHESETSLTGALDFKQERLITNGSINLQRRHKQQHQEE